MTQKQICLDVIRRKYGAQAQKMAATLYDAESMSVAELCRVSEIPPKKLRQLMILFYKLDLIEEFSAKKNHFSLKIGSLVELTRVDLTLYFLRRSYGDIVESLAITLVLNGFISYEACVHKTQEFLSTTTNRQQM